MNQKPISSEIDSCTKKTPLCFGGSRLQQLTDALGKQDTGWDLTSTKFFLEHGSGQGVWEIFIDEIGN